MRLLARRKVRKDWHRRFLHGRLDDSVSSVAPDNWKVCGLRCSLSDKYQTNQLSCTGTWSRRSAHFLEKMLSKYTAACTRQAVACEIARVRAENDKGIQ